MCTAGRPCTRSGPLLILSAVCRQEGMSSVLAAGGLLEGLARGTAALAPASPACQALSHILTQVCTQSLSSTVRLKSQREQQAANQSVKESASARVDASLEPVLEQAAQQQQAGIVTQQGAAAIACCQTWQVSITCFSLRILDCCCLCFRAAGLDSCLSPKSHSLLHVQCLPVCTASLSRLGQQAILFVAPVLL